MTGAKTEESRVCLSGATILTFDDDGTIIERGDIWFQDGVITSVGEAGGFRPGPGGSTEMIDVSGKIVIPGFINAHTHSYTALLKGTVEREPLDIYMLHVIAAGDAMTPREIYVSAQLDALSMLRRGITSIIDHYSERPATTAAGLDAVCTAFEDIGIRATVAPMFSDRPYVETIPLDPASLPNEILDWYASWPRPDADAYFSLMESALARRSPPDNRVNVILGVDGPQRCSPRLMELTADFQQQHAAPLQTHMLETKTQAAMKSGTGFVRRMVDAGVLNDRSSLVHFIWSNSEDMAAAREAGVTVVHCPQSNTMLGAGICPVMRLRSEGIPVAYGTDGSNCGPASYLENLRLATFLMRLTEPDFEKWPASLEILTGAYRAGARAVGHPQDLGRIEAGARADLVVLDPSGHWHMPMGDPVRHVLHYETGESVESVWVDGRRVVDKRSVVAFEEESLLAEAGEIVERRRRGLPRAAIERIDAQYPAMRDMLLEQLAKDTGIERRITLA